MTGINVLDGSGAKQVLEAKFTRDSTNPLKWQIDVLDADAAVLGSGSILFDAAGSPVADNAEVKVSVTPKDEAAFDVTFSFGKPGAFAGTTSLADSASSQLAVQNNDGVQLGTLSSTSFDDRGRLTLKYSNGKTLTPATLLLARFTAPDEFKSLGGGLFTASDVGQPALAAAQSGGRGRIVGGSLELSNVELTQQFTNLIILQRGYQASSQMASVANEMIQQLLAMGEHR